MAESEQQPKGQHFLLSPEMPDAHRYGLGKGPRGDGLRLVQAHALAADGRRAVLSAVRDTTLPYDGPRPLQVL